LGSRAPHAGVEGRQRSTKLMEAQTTWPGDSKACGARGPNFSYTRRRRRSV